MKTKLPWILTFVLAIALGVVLFARTSPRQPATSNRQPLYWVDPMHPSYRSDKPGTAPDCGMDLVPVYEEKRPRIDVPSSAAELRTIGRSVRTVGRVAIDETRMHTITTKFDGYIERLYVDFTGKDVRRGQPLFSVYSPDLLATQQEYLLALRSAKQAPLLLDAARRRLQLWDISDADVRELERSGATRKTMTITSPVSGVVLEKMAVQGARVMAGAPMFTIAALDRVWIVADVYESELAWVRTGAPASMTLTYLPGRTFTGVVTFIAPTIDPMTRTAKVRIEVDNRDGALKPEMFGDVTLQEPARSAVVVPDSAVLMTGTRNVVFIVKGDGTFEPRDVEIGTKSEHAIEIRRGLVAGEKVATGANFLLDSESRLRLKPETRNQKAEGAAHAHE
jgi:Cu(I)/Ag(I) efflux system membrane fusion protein